MRHGSLFSGIGGWSIASDWMGWKTVFNCEINDFGQKVLKYYWPNAEMYEDIKKTDFTKWRGQIDILTNSFPCQGFSLAGKRKGTKDNRYLWPESLRVIKEIQPTWVVSENVPGIITIEKGMVFEQVQTDLEAEGYEVFTFVLPACGVNAPHRRDRVWFVAYNKNLRCRTSEKIKRERDECKCERSEIRQTYNKYGRCRTTPDPGLQRQEIRQEQTTGIEQRIEVNFDTDFLNSDNAGHNSGTISQQQTPGIQINSDVDYKSMEGHSWDEFTKGQKETFRRNGKANWLRDWIEVASELCRSNARVSHRMDRIKALGNSVNPYVVYQIFKAIEEFKLISETSKA